MKILIMVIIGLMGCAGSTDDNKGALNTLPKPAAAALQARAGTASIERTHREVEGGKTYYEGVWHVNGARHEVKVTADGTVVEVEEEVAADQVPEAVRTTAARELGQQVAKFERQMDGSYEAEVVVNGKEKEVRIGTDGTVLPPDEDAEEEGGAGDADDDDED